MANSWVIDRKTAEHNLRHFYNMGEPTSWYAEARSDIREMAEFFGIEYHIASAVVAVLSPQVQWESKSGVKQNLNAASFLIDGYLRGYDMDTVINNVQGYRANRIKAWRIMQERDIDYVRGDKVIAFYKNFIGINSAVTTDSWMYRAAVNDPELVETSPYFSKANNTLVQTIVQEIASDNNEDALDTQARIWLAIKRISKLRNS